MRAIAQSTERGPIVSSAVVASALGVLVFTVFTGFAPQDTAPIVAVMATAAVAYRSLLSWRNLVALLALVILFIPMRRYELPGNLPFKLEPYRLLVALLVLAWLGSLLYDPRVRWRKSGLDAPLLVFVFAILGSQLVNGGRVRAEEAHVAKQLTFFFSFLLVFYLVVSVVRTLPEIDLIVKVLVGGGALVAVFAVVESRTGYNVFNHLRGIVPALQLDELPRSQDRGARLRAYGSAEHPIALGAALVMLLPLAFYLGQRTGRRRWWLAALLLAVGVLSTVARTGVLMLLVAGCVYLWLRPRQTRRLWPLLLPMLVLVHLALPGALGTFKNAFSPPGGLIAEQRSSAGTYGSGRIADVGPSMKEFKHKPLLGDGFGTRVTDWGKANAPILDDQWLGTLLETGLVGALALSWLFCRSIRRLARAAKDDGSERGWLLTGLAASIAAYAVGMVTYDAFAFSQVTFLLFFMLAIAAVVLAGPEARKTT